MSKPQKPRGLQGNIFADRCPSRKILQHVTGRWGMLVLVALQGGKHRFSELRRKIKGISEKMLTQTLRQLEEDGFVKRTAHPVVPPHVEYNLTTTGKTLSRKVSSLTVWIEKHLGEILGNNK